MMVKIYTDSNVLRYFGTAFAHTSLPDDLQVQLLLAPLSTMELMSQLGTDGAEEAFAAFQALPKFHNPRATGVLPWSDNLFRYLLKLPPLEDTITTSLNNAVINILNSTGAGALRADGEKWRAIWDREKRGAANNFSAVLDSWRAEGPLSEAEHRAIFARSIARRAGADESAVDVDSIVMSLNAHYVFEHDRMEAAAENPDYNVSKHENDVIDAELLIYLADPELHLLTSDKGFRRVARSSQASQVHIIEQASLIDAKCASEVIRSIVESVPATN